MKLYQFLEISQLDRTQFAGLVNYQVELISIYLDKDPAEVVNMKKSEFNSTIKMIESELKAIKWQSKIEVDGIHFELKPFESMTLGEFIDLESYLSNKEIAKILSVIYRQVERPVLQKPIWEDYSKIDINERAKLFLEIDADNVIGVLPELRKFRDKLVNSYDALFSSNDDSEDSATNIEEAKLEQAKKFHQTFAWEAFILFLANDDVTKWDQIVEMPVILAFNLASYRKSIIKNQQNSEYSQLNTKRMRR